MIIYKVYQEYCPCCESQNFERYFISLEGARKFQIDKPHTFIKEIKVYEFKEIKVL